jgi:hypothetical protein
VLGDGSRRGRGGDRMREEGEREEGKEGKKEREARKVWVEEGWWKEGSGRSERKRGSLVTDLKFKPRRPVPIFTH